MAELRQVDVDLDVNDLGDWIVLVGGQQVVGIVWDADSPSDPKIVVWDEDGDPVFTTPLFDLNPEILTTDETMEV